MRQLPTVKRITSANINLKSAPEHLTFPLGQRLYCCYTRRNMNMNTSVFKGTMAEMSYPQIEAAIQQQAAVLLPVSVIEEHGPHLCTGTDMYLTGVVCRKIRDELQQQGKSTVIAPPFYWGINSITCLLYTSRARPASPLYRRQTILS